MSFAYCPILSLRVWSALLHFAAMSSDTPDTVAEFAAEYYEFYQLAVYENLFVGIVYGEGLG